MTAAIITEEAGQRPDGATAWVFSMQLSGGGVPKLAVREARLTTLGLEGDVQRDKEHHGGPDRALCLYALERITALQLEGHRVFPGALGENLTITGLDWASITPGTRIRIGDEAIVEVTSFATPCRTIAAAFFDGRFGRVSHKTHPGWSRLYTRVIAEGIIRAADKVSTESPSPPADLLDNG